MAPSDGGGGLSASSTHQRQTVDARRHSNLHSNRTPNPPPHPLTFALCPPGAERAPGAAEEVEQRCVAARGSEEAQGGPQGGKPAAAAVAASAPGRGTVRRTTAAVHGVPGSHLRLHPARRYTPGHRLVRRSGTATPTSRSRGLMTSE